MQQESNCSYSITFVLSEGSLCNLLVQLHIQIHLRTAFFKNKHYLSVKVLDEYLKLISNNFNIGRVDLDSS